MRFWLTRQLQSGNILHQSTWRRESKKETGESQRRVWDTVFVAAENLMWALWVAALRCVLYHIVRYILIFKVTRRKADGMNTVVMLNFRYWELAVWWVVGCILCICYLQGGRPSLTLTMTTAVYAILFKHIVAVCVLVLCVCVCVFYSWHQYLCTKFPVSRSLTLISSTIPVVCIVFLFYQVLPLWRHPAVYFIWPSYFMHLSHCWMWCDACYMVTTYLPADVVSQGSLIIHTLPWNLQILY
jgi:hypothetical protein